jgi:hypothetical protein
MLIVEEGLLIWYTVPVNPEAVVEAYAIENDQDRFTSDVGACTDVGKTFTL